MRLIKILTVIVLALARLNTSAHTDITYCRAKWSFSPDAPYISGTVMYNFKSTAESITTIDFDLSNHLHVDKILYHNSTLPFTHKKSKIEITLPNSVEPGVTDSIEIEYHGKTVSTGLGTICFDKQAHTAWTVSEPWGGRDWWPCRQNLSDKIDSMDIYVTCPAHYLVGTHGRLTGYVENGATHTAHYKVSHPVNYYTVGIAVGIFNTTESVATLSDGGKIELIDYYPPSFDYYDKMPKNIANFVNFFSDYWIPYPFADEKYGQVFVGGKLSIEHQTMSFLSFDDIGTIAHELAHQWFGNYVTCCTWQNIWFNEAFASFGELLILEKYYSDFTIQWKEYTRKSAITSKRRIFLSDTLNPDAVLDIPTTYNKSAMMLVMLRNEIGTHAFQKGCRAILEKYANGFAGIENARECFEAAADTSLTDFFNKWIYGIGHPVYTVGFDKIGNGKTNITIRQTTTDKSVDFYPLHVTVRLTGGDQYKDVRLHHTQQVQTFTVETDFDVEDVIFDPESDILCTWSKRR